MTKKSKALELFDTEKEAKARRSLYIKESLQKKVYQISEESGRSVNEVVERILEKFLEG